MGPKQFIEIKQVGSRFVRHDVVATQFPEMQLIRDMIVFYEGRWEEADESDVEELMKRASRIE